MEGCPPTIRSRIFMRGSRQGRRLSEVPVECLCSRGIRSRFGPLRRCKRARSKRSRNCSVRDTADGNKRKAHTETDERGGGCASACEGNQDAAGKAGRGSEALQHASLTDQTQGIGRCHRWHMKTYDNHSARLGSNFVPISLNALNHL